MAPPRVSRRIAAIRRIAASGYIPMRWNQHRRQGMNCETSEKNRLPAVATSANPHAIQTSYPSRLSRAAASSRRALCDQMAAMGATRTIASSTWTTTAAAASVVETTSVASFRPINPIVPGLGQCNLMKDLHLGEEIIYEGHPSWRSILGYYIKGLIGALIVAVVAYLLDGV